MPEEVPHIKMDPFTPTMLRNADLRRKDAGFKKREERYIPDDQLKRILDELLRLIELGEGWAAVPMLAYGYGLRRNVDIGMYIYR